MVHDDLPVSIISAMTDDRIIGNKGNLPWGHKSMMSDMRRFRDRTAGRVVIMGRATYESIPKTKTGEKLPGRRKIVLTRKGLWSKSEDASNKVEFAHVEVAPSFEHALALAAKEPEILVIGGANVYAAGLRYAKRMYITYVHAPLPGDVYFPEWDRRAWHDRLEMNLEKNADDAYPSTFMVYERR